jgi:flagellar basal body-associated protein FliL
MEAEEQQSGPSGRTKTIVAIVVLVVVVMLLMLYLGKFKGSFRNPKSIKDSNEEDKALYPMVKRLLDKQEELLRDSI